MSSQPLFNFSFARNHQILAIRKEDGSIQVQHCDATSLDGLLEVQRICQQPVDYIHCPSDQLGDAISLSYQAADNAMDSIDELNEVIDLDQLAENIPQSQDLLDGKDDAPIIRLINALFADALRQGASDIHIETFEDKMAVRLRVDGVLKEVLTPHRHAAPLLVSRIKVMARLDIAEKRVPQDGRVSLRMAGRALDVRVSTIPSIHGERVVMRILDKQAEKLDLTGLGMPADTLEQFAKLLALPNGIILVTGPTGSGKTTTLYAGLTTINDKSRNILTVEDPVEYALEGIGQTPVNDKANMTFARGLRAILRQDPDVVMIGEIRDPETAQIAVQASLTGHLVLSTLHTNDSLGAVTRLMDIGIEPYLIASSLKGVLAQRLVRTLCQSCKRPVQLSLADAEALGDESLAGSEVYHPEGCNECHHTGYQGRRGLYELLTVDYDLSKMIHDQAGEPAMRQAVSGQLRTMMGEGRALICQGLTSPEEVLRTVKEGSDSASL